MIFNFTYYVLHEKSSLSVDGEWSDYSEWTECPVNCGGGLQSRSRTCSNPAPAHGGEECAGDSEESRECNTYLCQGEIL